VIIPFPTDRDLITEIEQLRRETEALDEEREWLLARISAQEKKLRRITRLLDDLCDLWTELH
jgi:hypothetical protein